MSPDAEGHPAHHAEEDSWPTTPFVLRVGLTGGIATGKSTVGRIFIELGATVLDADQIAHRLIDRGAPAYDRVVKAFGSEIMRADGSIDRSRLGSVIFADAGRRRVLESILHPLIRAEEAARIESHTQRGGRIAVSNGALLIEAGIHRDYHRLVVVHCDASIQIERLMNRDKLSETDARARIEVQMPTSEKLKLAHYTIDTSPGFEATESGARAIFRHLQFDLRALSKA